MSFRVIRLALLLLALHTSTVAAQVIPLDITSVATTNLTGTTTTRSIAESTSGVTSVTYNGAIRRLDRFVAGGVNYLPELTNGVVQVVRNGINGSFTSNPSTATNNPNQNVQWNFRQGLTGTSLTVRGEYVNNMGTLLGRNNMQMGSENLFVNQIPSGDQSIAINVERIDYIFTGGFTAWSGRGFAVFERGLFGNGSRGNARVAAITALTAGVPSNFSTNIADLNGSATPPWGNTNLAAPSTGYDVFRYRVQNDTGLNFHQDLSASAQGIGGVFLRSTDFVPAGTTLFGFSIFARDVTATGSALANLSNYPTNTTISGDFDIVSTGAMLFAVPEPTTYALLAGAAAVAGWWFTRRRGKDEPKAQSEVAPTLVHPTSAETLD